MLKQSHEKTGKDLNRHPTRKDMQIVKNHTKTCLTLYAIRELQIKIIRYHTIPIRTVKNDRMISVHFQGKPFYITVIQVYAPTSNAEEAEAEWFYEDLQDLLELIPIKDVFFIIGDQNVKVGIQEIPGITSLALKYKMKQGRG